MLQERRATWFEFEIFNALRLSFRTTVVGRPFCIFASFNFYMYKMNSERSILYGIVGLLALLCVYFYDGAQQNSVGPTSIQKMVSSTSTTFSTTIVNSIGTNKAIRSSEFKPNDPAAVPAIAIIGTAKGGTTDIYEQLVQVFPNVQRGSSEATMNGKELFDLVYFDKTPGSPEFWEYLRKMDHPCSKHRGLPFTRCIELLSGSDASRVPITIDATPSYLERFSVPFTLRSVSPNTKIIILLRDPVDRAESLYNHWDIESGGTRWHGKDINDLVEEFFQWVNTSRVSSIFSKLLSSTDMEHTQILYGELISLGLLGGFPRMLFGGAFYPYGMINWRRNYFQPGRVLIIDSHTYFKDRNAIVQNVAEFVFGRDPTPEEWDKSHSMGVANSKRTLGHSPPPDSVLSSRNRWLLTELYKPHMDKMLKMLPELREEGAMVVGFEGEPWNKWRVAASSD